MSTKLILPFLLILYPLIYLINLTKLPLYLDEGLYIFWSYLFSVSDGFAYISMQDGKTPLFIWITTWVNPLFNNFLFTGRFVSVTASFISLICWLIIVAKTTGRKSLIFTTLLFLVTPFNTLISRLAFVDSLLIAFGSLSILGMFLAKEQSLKKHIWKTSLYALLSGVFLGLAFLTKSTAKIFLLGEIILLIFWGLQLIKGRRIKSILLLIISGILITALYYEIIGYLKFGALRHWEMIANKEEVLVFSLPELYRKFFIERNYSAHIKNIPIYFEYFFYYFGPILFFFFAGIVWVLKVRKHFWILILAIIFASGVFLSAKVPASRYLAIIIPEISIVSGFGLFWIWNSKIKVLKIISVILIIFSAFISGKMIIDPINAYYSSDDRANFVDYNLNALGLEESVKYLSARKDSSAVAVTGIWGVAEGAKVAFEEKGIENYPVGRVVTEHTKEDFCEEDYQELDGKCWNIDFGDVLNSNKPEKYIYFMNEIIDIETLKKLKNVTTIYEFKRPTGMAVYLLRINP